MSRLDELIQELCPDGVRFVRIQDCCSLEKGKTPIQKAIPGEYPLVVTTAERKTSNTYQFDKPSVCIPLVSSRGHGVASLNEVFYQEGKFALGNILCAVSPIDTNILSAKFLSLYLNYAKDILLVPQMKGGANVSLSIDAIGRCKIPAPPIEVQREIVRILDKFTELSAELSVELSARQKQYHYYLDKLMTPKSDCQHRSLGEICKIETGKLNSNAATEDGSYMFFTTAKEPSKIDYYRWDTEALLIAGNANVGNVKHYKGKFEAYQRTYVLTEFADNVNIRFLYYVLRNNLKTYLDKNKNEAAMTYIVLPTLQHFTFPLPSLDIQQHIVNILDNFEAICSDLQSGLPAEIEARQKQYEYYRDKLLNFKEMSVQ